MDLFHFAEVEVKLEELVYDQFRHEWQAKPVGLWVSVGDEWKEWCVSENFAIEDLTFKHQVILKSDANILYLDTPEKIFELSKKYPSTKESVSKLIGLDSSNELDWIKIKSEYQGIIIAPYQWECRLALESTWYYGWDCASGCIWDISCIESFELVKQEVITNDMVQSEG